MQGKIAIIIEADPTLNATKAYTPLYEPIQYAFFARYEPRQHIVLDIACLLITTGADVGADRSRCGEITLLKKACGVPSEKLIGAVLVAGIVVNDDYKIKDWGRYACGNAMCWAVIGGNQPIIDALQHRGAYLDFA